MVPRAALVQGLITGCLLALVSVPAPAQEDPQPSTAEGGVEPALGRWDLTVATPEGHYPSWLEIRKSGIDTLVGSYVGRFGSARPVAEIERSGTRYRFTIPRQWEQRSDDLTFDFVVDGDELRGETTDASGRRLTWIGVKADPLEHRSRFDRQPQWGPAIELFNGRDLAGWTTQLPRPNGWQVEGGILYNRRPGNNLVTERTFEDFKLVAEFRYPKGSNSGIYLRGRYEVQIQDTAHLEPDSHYGGGIYGHLTPVVNAARPHDQWQSCEVTLLGRRVTVVLNGQTILDRQIIPGITGGALDSREGEPGPILIQGDHGPVEFRRITLTPAVD